MTTLAPTLQAFFTDRLINQRYASQHTIAAYRDTLRLLLRFSAEHAGTLPSDLDISDLDAPLISAFLDHGTPAAPRHQDGPGASRPPGAGATGSPVSPAHLV